MRILTGPAEQVRFADVLKVGEFRALWLAEAQSSLGDQLARLSLAVIVFDRTRSASLSALVYALTFLPALLGGALLAGLADRFQRRELMVTCDLFRFVLVVVMAIPRLPIPILVGLLICVVLAESPFKAAQSALVPEMLTGEQYVVGTGLRGVTTQLAQLVGFGAGGLLIAAIGGQYCLLVDAVTFLCSAVLLRTRIRPRPRPGGQHGQGLAGPSHGGYFASMLAGLGLVFGSIPLRTLMGLVWLAAFFVVPEGLAPSYVAATHAGDGAVGLLMAADPAGFALGTFLLLRIRSSDTRHRLIGPLAIAAGVPLMACYLHPGLAVSAVLWGLCGMLSAYQTQATSEFVMLVPPDQRGQAIGFAASGLIAVQGIGIALAGLLSSATSPATAIAAAGTGATVLAILLGLQWSKLATVDDSRAR